MPAILTELDAVNTVLTYAGLQPVNSLTLGDSESSLVQRVIQEEKELMLSRGVVFNTQVITIVPDANDNILVPANAIVCLPVSEKTCIVQRGDFLYDTTNNTDEFTSSVKVRLFLELDFEDLPYLARKYITLSATKKVLIRFESSPQVIALVEDDYIEAKCEYERYLLDEEDTNFMDAEDLQSARYRKNIIDR